MRKLSCMQNAYRGFRFSFMRYKVLEKLIVSSLLASCERLEVALQQYTSEFNNTTLINFSFSEADRKKYLKKYNIFSAELANITRAAEGEIASLSVMILEADRKCDIPTTERLNDIFEKYQTLSRSLTDFICKSEKVFLKNITGEDVFRPSELLSISKELLCAAENFKKYLEERK